jgi:hypothetical protein
VTETDIAALIRAVAPFGLTFETQHATVRTVRLSRAVAAMEQAFQVKL